MNTDPQPSDGGSAFPLTHHEYLSADQKEWHKQFQLGGLSIRDYFAAQAIGEQFKFAVSVHEQDQQARRCYDIADAMLRARQPIAKPPVHETPEMPRDT